MADSIVNRVESSSTHVPGRTLNSARTHHFVIDGTSDPHEELTPVEVFLSAISACGVHLIERFAQESNIQLQRVEATIEGSRPTDEPHRFEHIDLAFRLTGPSQEEADALVERFKNR